MAPRITLTMYMIRVRDALVVCIMHMDMKKAGIQEENPQKATESRRWSWQKFAYKSLAASVLRAIAATGAE